MGRAYEDNREQAAYENACYCLYYGYGYKYWRKNNKDLVESDEKAREIWEKAFDEMSRDI